MDRGDWQATVHVVAELDMTERLSPSLTSFTSFICSVSQCWRLILEHCPFVPFESDITN